MNINEWKYVTRKLNEEYKNYGVSDFCMYEENNIVMVCYVINESTKTFSYDIGKRQRISNVFDDIYGYTYFLKSYLINGKERLFVGKVDLKTGVVSPIGFDVNKKKYMSFIIDRHGLIDENEMVKSLENDKTEGIDPKIYQEIDKGNLLRVLVDLNVAYITPYIMHGIDDMNRKIKESVYAK